MFKILPLSLLQSLFLCGGQVLLKQGLSVSGPFSWSWRFFQAQLANWWYLGCGGAFGIATLLWIYILKHYPFSIAYPLSCISYVFGMLAAAILFKENVTPWQWAGVVLIVVGSALLVK